MISPSAEQQIRALKKPEPRASRSYLDDVILGQYQGWNDAIDAVLPIVTTLLASLSQELETAKAELRSVDAVMERRPALDQPTRWQNIQKAITMAAKADEAIRLIDAEKRRADRAEQSLETVKGERDRLQAEIAELRAIGGPYRVAADRIESALLRERPQEPTTAHDKPNGSQG